jgi:hypothetical protein
MRTVYFARVGLNSLDRKTGEEIRREVGEEVPAEVVRYSPWVLEQGMVVEAEEVEGITAPAHFALIQAGYVTWAALEQASDEELLAIEGIGPATLNKIRGRSVGEEERHDQNAW